jgi:hypothetical protein
MKRTQPSHAWWIGPLLAIFFVGLLWVGLVPPSKAAVPPAGPPVIQFEASGDHFPTLEQAREDAAEKAKGRLRWALLQDVHPPIERVPSTQMILEQLTRSQTKDSVPVPEYNEPYIGVTLTIEVRPEHLQMLRRAERVADTGWLLAAACGALAVISLGFRLDEWTKGYLTRWLIIGAAGVIGLVAAAWWFIAS